MIPAPTSNGVGFAAHTCGSKLNSAMRWSLVVGPVVATQKAYEFSAVVLVGVVSLLKELGLNVSITVLQPVGEKITNQA